VPETGSDDVAASVLPAIAAAIAALFARSQTGDPVMDKIVERARRSRRIVNREGFRRQDERDPAMLTAIEASLPAAIALRRALHDLCATLGKGSFNARFDGDRRTFFGALRQIYGPPPEHAG
jgi:hypothetical protein